MINKKGPRWETRSADRTSKLGRVYLPSPGHKGEPARCGVSHGEAEKCSLRAGMPRRRGRSESSTPQAEGIKGPRGQSVAALGASQTRGSNPQERKRVTHLTLPPDVLPGIRRVGSVRGHFCSSTSLCILLPCHT